MALALAPELIAATVTLNLSMAVAVGASMSTAWLRCARSPWAAANLVRLRTATRAALAAAAAAYVAILWLEAANMAEVPFLSAAPAVKSVLEATHYGFAWTIGLCALAVAVAASVFQRGAGVLVRLLALGVFMYSRSMVSHAGAGGDVSWAVAADWTHLVLISVWVGEVLVAAAITLAPASAADPGERRERGQYINALSHSATLALVGIFATGLFSAWRGLGSLDNVTGNDYANVLLIKVALVMASAILGGANRFVVMPRLLPRLLAADPMDTSERRFQRILQIESLVLVAAVILAAILSSTSPPTAG